MADMAVAQLAEQRRQYEARIAELKESHEQRVKELLRTVTAVAEEVEFLRAQHFGPRTLPTTGPAQTQVWPEPDFMPDANPHLYLSEEEEEIRALHSGGHIDLATQNAALAQLRAAFGDSIQIESS